MKNKWANLYICYILLLIFQNCIFSCPKCNEEFYKELLTNRANTLGGQELLEAIKNQTDGGQSPNFNVPSSYNSLTDLKGPDISVNTDINSKENTIGSDSDIFYYLTLFTKIFIIGILVTCFFLIAAKYILKFKREKAS